MTSSSLLDLRSIPKSVGMCRSKQESADINIIYLYFNGSCVFMLGISLIQDSLDIQVNNQHEQPIDINQLLAAYCSNNI